MSNVSKGQIQLPAEFRPGEPIRASEMDKLRKAIAFALKDMIGGGRGITVSQSAGKYLISARRQRGGESTPNFPFEIVQSAPDKIKLHYGLVNNNPPVIGEDPLTIDIEDSPELTLSGTATHPIWIKVTINASFEILSEEIVTAAFPPPVTETEGFGFLGTVTTVDDVITAISQTWKTNCTYFYAGEDDHLFFL